MKNDKISLWTAVLMIINIMVGGGILMGPGRMAAVAGNASFLGWPLVALLFLPIVLCTVQLSAMFPGQGGFYLYARKGLNRTAGFLSGWLYVIGYTLAAAVELLALREIFIQCLNVQYWFIQNSYAFYAVIVAVCIGLNLLSIRVFGRIINSLTIFKLLPLIILIGLLPFLFNPNFSITTHDIALLPFSLPFAIFGYFGFEYCCSMSHLIEDSEKNGPRAIMLGFSATALLYMLFHFGLLNIMGAQNLAEYSASAFPQFIKLPMAYFITLLNILIPTATILTFFASINGMMNANSLLMQAMALDGLFKSGEVIAQTNKNGRPWVAITLQGLSILFLVCVLPFITVMNGLCNMGILLSFILPFVSLLMLQYKAREYSRMILTVVALLITAGLEAYSLYCLADTMMQRFVYGLPFVGVVILGLVLLDQKHPQNARA